MSCTKIDDGQSAWVTHCPPFGILFCILLFNSVNVTRCVCLFIKQPPSYEDAGDDGIVPSTPTLFVPRRTDGFGEAVSSPQVPSGRFIFSDTNPPTARAGIVTCVKHTVRLPYISVYTGHFIMFSVITNIYNKKTKGPTLMELFTATGKLKKFL